MTNSDRRLHPGSLGKLSRWGVPSAVAGAIFGLVAALLASPLRPAQPPPYGWTLTCGEKPDVVVWIDAPASTPPLPVSAWVFWSETSDPTQGLWARAEGGGKVAVYAALPHGVYVWPAWEVAGVSVFPGHAEFCP